jgi:hypothetical protein
MIDKAALGVMKAARVQYRPAQWDYEDKIGIIPEW